MIGAGAVGGSIGAALFAAGREVVLVARGAHHDAIAARGLSFVTPAGTASLPIPVVGGPHEIDLRRDDVLLLAVKVQDSVDALDQWSGRPVAGGGTAGSVLPLLCAQNGVEGERIALRRFAQVYGVCVMLPGTYLSAGEITSYGDPMIGVLTIGWYPAGVDDLVRRICADLEASRIGGHPSESVMRWKYTKLLANLGNALEAISGPIESKAAEALLRRARDEGESVLRAAGIDFASDDEDARVRRRMHLVDIPGHPHGGGSTWQSMTRGTGSVETDYLSGEIVLLGRLHGVATPVNETLRRVAWELSRQGRGPAAMTVEELRAQIDPAARG